MSLSVKNVKVILKRSQFHLNTHSFLSPRFWTKVQKLYIRIHATTWVQARSTLDRLQIYSFKLVRFYQHCSPWPCSFLSGRTGSLVRGRCQRAATQTVCFTAYLQRTHGDRGSSPASRWCSRRHCSALQRCRVRSSDVLLLLRP